MSALLTVAGVPFDQAFALFLLGGIVAACVTAAVMYCAWQRDRDRDTLRRQRDAAVRDYEDLLRLFVVNNPGVKVGRVDRRIFGGGGRR